MTRVALAALVLLAWLATVSLSADENAAWLTKKPAERRDRSELLERHVHRIVEKLVEAGKFAEARQALKRNARLLKAEHALEPARWVVRWSPPGWPGGWGLPGR